MAHPAPPSAPAPPPAEDLPIDIDYAKFLAWLVDRRRVPRDWHTHLKAARALARHALTQTPTPAQRALHTPPNPSYFAAADALRLLASDQAPAEWHAGPAKDLLGRYVAPPTRAWAAAVAAFERKSVFLADCAQVLVRNTDVEARALKARIAALHADAAEYARRDAPAVRTARDARERFEAACREFGLPPEGEVDYEHSLAAAVEESVPRVLASAVRAAKEGGLAEALRYYAEFVALGGGRRPVCEAVGMVLEGDDDDLIRPRRRAAEGDGEVAEVDWGVEAVDEVGGSAEGGVIDWGIEIDVAGEGAGEEGDAGAGSSVVQGGGIDWNDGGGVVDGDETVTEVDVGDEGDDDAFTLADASSREIYLNELIELDAFLTQRVTELSRSGDSEIGLVLQQWSDRPSCMSRFDAAEVSKLRDDVCECMRALNGVETRRLLALQREKRFVERAARDVVQKKHAAERMHAAIAAVRRRKERATAELKEAMEEWDKLEKETAMVKRRTEEALGKLYRGRRVVILGEINQVFSLGKC